MAATVTFSSCIYTLDLIQKSVRPHTVQNYMILLNNCMGVEEDRTEKIWAERNFLYLALALKREIKKRNKKK